MLNSIVLQGRLTKDVELRYTKSENAVCTFTIAVDRGDKERNTDFITCVAWKQTAQFVDQYFNKGDMMLVQGRLEQRNYEDSNGNKRSAFEVRVANVNFCGSKNKAENPGKPQFVEGDDSAGDLPF